ncbi:MAG: nuclear transport factor 2 family protein [Paucibacter sp.]|nr:nuclear transport factor 2 family protein [Roseateles sp.]
MVALESPAEGQVAAGSALEDAAAEVRSTELAFADAMARRDLVAFGEYVAVDAVFRGRTLRQGRSAVIDAWKPYFTGDRAPFSWSPDAVTVSADGHYGLSTGLVRDPAGKVEGRFTSIWRREADGHWRVIVDQGVDACSCAVPASSPASN